MSETRRIPTASLDPLAAKLGALAPLQPGDLELIGRRLGDVRTHALRDDILGNEPGNVRLVMNGWVGLVRILSDGRRQILQLAIPGDVISAAPLAEAQLVALTYARTTDAGGLALAARRGDGSGLSRAWKLAEQDAQRCLLAQITRLGVMTAYERTANWIVELVRRHARAGLGDGRRMAWPVTQEVLADILGLSIVHVNRILQQLRRDRLIELRAGALHVLDPEQLAAAGLADPAGRPEAELDRRTNDLSSITGGLRGAPPAGLR